MGTKRAVCAPSGAEMYTSDNRRLQSSIGAALLIVPHAQWAFLSLSVFLSVSFSLYDHIQTVFLMRDWKNWILIGLLELVTVSLYLVVSHQQTCQNRVDTWASVRFITPLWVQTSLVILGWSQVIAGGELPILGLPTESVHVYLWLCICVQKRGGGVVKGLWVFPMVLLLTWSPKNNKTTWLPQDLSGIIKEVPHYSELGWEHYC